MRLMQKLLDRMRTVLKVRTKRQLPPSLGKPSLGGSIVKDRFRIRVKHPIDDELWNWLFDMGWRPMPVHNNRRKYVVIAEKSFDKFVNADPSMRADLHARLTEGRSTRRD